METQFDNTINLQAVYMQCTWANAYTVPGRKRANCIQSYDRGMINKLISRYGYFKTSGIEKVTGWKNMKYTWNQIGYLTGNYVDDENDDFWFEVHLLLSNRMQRGWMKYNDIWFANKGVPPNKKDWEFIPYTPTDGGNGGNGGNGGDDIPKKKSILSWLLSGLTLYSILR